ncbi:hypothetical protein NGH46_12525 [Staphylococcus xylosus]|uniref:hypothetical protein n=1 Tax=Staphylococcus xylosus TaxID=1288 RepID=UPI002DB67736|nr:hypothetical protein [Staphylococcus xylosus]MEB8122950.1 hypothetical protein [Staphylococcus xylosus]
MDGNLDKMIAYLTKNNHEMFNAYIDGYYTAKNLAEDVGLKRHSFYLAVQKIDPEYSNKRKAIRENRLNTIERCIKNLVPFEHMDVDIEALLGLENYKKKQDANSVKISVSVQLKQNGNDLKGIKFMSWSTFLIWYKRYCIIKDIEESSPTIETLNKRYGLSKTKIRQTRDFYQSEGRVLFNATPETESIFVRNLELYEQKRSTNETHEALAQQYNVDLDIVPKIISSIEHAKNEVMIDEQEDKA